jgi:hypothetical protein
MDRKKIGMCVQGSVALRQGPQAGPYEHGNYSSDSLNSPNSLTTLAPISFSTWALRRRVHLFNFFFQLRGFNVDDERRLCTEKIRQKERKIPKLRI